MTTSSQKDLTRQKRVLIYRVFLLVCLILVVLDFPLMVYIDNDYLHEHALINYNRTVDIVNYFSNTPLHPSAEREQLQRAISSERLQFSMSSQPQYELQFNSLASHPIVKNASINDGELDQDYFTQPHPYLEFSYYLVTKKLWLNFLFKEHSYPFLAFLFALVELVLFIAAMTFLVSSYRFLEPWHKIRSVCKRLGIPMQQKTLPLLGSAVIKESIYLMETLAQKIDILISERIATIASLSHDIRTPLTRAQFYLQKVTDPQLSQQLQKQIDEIKYYLNQTLSYAKQDYHEEPKRALDVISLVETYCDEMQAINAPVTFHTEVKRYVMEAQKIGLQRAIGNIISNGIKYGKVVHVQLETVGAALHVIIDDQGPGLQPTEFDKVFKPF